MIFQQNCDKNHFTMAAAPHNSYAARFGAAGAFMCHNVSYAMISATLGLEVVNCTPLMGFLVDLAEKNPVVIAMHTSNDPTRIAFYTFVQGYPNNFGYPGPLDNCVFAIGIFELVEVCIYNNFEDNVITM